MIITVYVCQSFGTIDTQITQHRAYKYYFNNSSPVSMCFRITKIKWNTAHWNKEPFSGCLQLHTWLHVYPDISKKSHVFKEFGSNCEQSKVNASILRESSILATSSMSKPLLARDISLGSKRFKEPLLTVEYLPLTLSSQTKRKEIGDSLRSHCNEHVGSMQMFIQWPSSWSGYQVW